MSVVDVENPLASDIRLFEFVKEVGDDVANDVVRCILVDWGWMLELELEVTTRNLMAWLFSFFTIDAECDAERANIIEARPGL